VTEKAIAGGVGDRDRERRVVAHGAFEDLQVVFGAPFGSQSRGLDLQRPYELCALLRRPEREPTRLARRS
jgi:hypothetical protein